MMRPGHEFESLFDAVIDGRCDDVQRRRFEEMVRDPAIRAAYLEQVRIHALLRWKHGRIGPVAEWGDQGPPRGAGPHRRHRGLVAVLLVGLGAFGLAWRVGKPGAERGVAVLVGISDVVWAEGQKPLAVGSRVGSRAVRYGSGRLTLALDSGARLAIDGPADFQVLSSTRLRAGRGRIIARAEGAARGFAIETPDALVVDQGTEVGVEVDASGRTGVVVFEGFVGLSRPGSAGEASPIKRLGQGEAMRVGRSGNLSRIVAVERRAVEGAWSTDTSTDPQALFRSVRDNIRGLGSSKYYRIVPRGLDEDAPAYVDRNHEWNGLGLEGLPSFLRGADYIMPFNEDKWIKNLQVTVEMARDATLYVLYDNREETPLWLSRRFTDTGIDIGLDEVSKPGGPLLPGRGPGRSVDNTFSVWKCEVARGESVEFGALRREEETKAMYGIAARPRP